MMYFFRVEEVKIDFLMEMSLLPIKNPYKIM